MALGCAVALVWAPPAFSRPPESAGSARVALTTAATGSMDVWLDADPGCGGQFHADIDDCWAIFHAWAFGAGRIAGVSTVFGNVSGPDAWQFAQNWSQRLRQQYPGRAFPPLYRGADGPARGPARDPAVDFRTASSDKSYTDQTDASAAMGRWLDASPAGTATVLLLGPVTNLAQALQTKPTRNRAIARVVMLGGQPPGAFHWLPVNGRLRMRDYNVIKDPHAMQVLLQAQVAIDFVPVQAAFGRWLTAAQLQPVIHRHDALQWLSASGAGWERFWTIGFGTPGYPPFDLLASALVMQPQRMVCQPVDAYMDAFPSLRGTQSGLALRPASERPVAQAAQATAPVVTGVSGIRYRRCELDEGDAVSLIKAAIERLTGSKPE